MPAPAVKYFYKDHEHVTPPVQHYMLQSMRVNELHTLRGVNNVFFVKHMGELWLWPIHSRGFEAFDTFIHNQVWEGEVFAKIDRKVAKAMGDAPGVSVIQAQADGGYICRLDRYGDLFVSDTYGGWDKPGRPRGEKPQFHENGFAWRSDMVAAACMLCPDKKPTCMMRGDGRGDYKSTPKDTRWVQDTQGRFHHARIEYDGTTSTGRVVEMAIAPACVNKTFVKLKPEFKLDVAVFEVAAHHGEMEPLSQRLREAACDNCAGCSHKKMIGKSRLERNENCVISTKELVADVLGWVDQTFGRRRLVNLLAAMDYEYRVRGQGRKAYRISGWNWRKGLVKLRHQVWTGGFHDGHKEIEALPADITAVRKAYTDSEEAKQSKVLRRYRQRTLDLECETDQFTISDENLAAVALTLNLFSHSDKPTVFVPKDMYKLKGFRTTIHQSRGEKHHIACILMDTTRRNNDEKRFWIMGWENTMEQFGSFPRSRYDEVKRGGLPPLPPTPSEPDSMAIMRSLPRISEGFQSQLLNRAVEDLVFPMFEDDNLKTYFNRRFFHGGDLCDPNADALYVLYKPRVNQLRQPMDDIAQVLGHMTFYCDVPAAGGWFSDDDVRAMLVAHRLRVVDARGVEIPDALQWIAPIGLEAGKPWATGPCEAGAHAYILPAEPGKSIPARLEVGYRMKVTSGEDSNKQAVQSLLFVQPLAPGRP